MTSLGLPEETVRLLEFGKAAAIPSGGSAYLDATGVPDPSQGIQTWITARMLHTYSLAKLLGYPGAAEIAQTALAGLTGVLHDDVHGGWYHAVDANGVPDFAAGKSAYDHAFVMLAAASAVQAGIPGAADLLAEASEVYLDKFWDDEQGRPVDGWNADFSELDTYRGLNATMHSVEAILSVADAVEEAEAALWRDRARRAAQLVVELAAEHDGRLPEHFTAAERGAPWTVDLDLNRDQPGDQFKPFGATPGHGMEWARLLLHLAAATDDAATSAELTATAKTLFDTAVADGWAVDGADGFVYTTDFDGKPVVRTRMHWVVCEAIAAAAALFATTGEQRYADAYHTWWNYAQRYLLDRDKGSWHHELDERNKPAATVWPGKPDIYHAVQATLLPRLPLAPMLAGALQERHLMPALPPPARPGTIVVIGEALIDILPDGTEAPGGSPANVALALGRLSRFPRLVTSFADDARGQALRDWLAESKVEVIATPPSTGRTSTAAVTLDDAGVASYKFDIAWEPPLNVALAAIKEAEALHVGSIAAVLQPGADTVEAAMRAARDAGTLVSFDPNARPTITPDLPAVRERVERLVSLSDVVKVSDEDLAWYYPGEAPEAVARRWAATGPLIVAVTLGGEGALGVQVDDVETIYRTPGVPVAVVDTVGAGDTFMGALLDALTRAYELPDALVYAARAAAINCTRAGANPPTRAELGE